MKALVTSDGGDAARPRASIAGWVSRTTSLPGLLYALLFAGATWYIAAFLVAAIFRLSYPFPLEVTEGPALRSVERVLRGESLYVAPTLQHVPYIYGPVYFSLSALVALVTGPSYLALRLVSLAASVGSLMLVGRLVQRETGSFGAGLVSAGLLAATYPAAQTAMDLGRVDALFVFFLVAGLYLARRESTRTRPRQLILAGSGCLLALASLTKIPMGAAPVVLALVVYLLATARGQVLAFVLGFGVPLGCALLGLRAQSGPWPTRYMWDLPSQHVVRESMLGRFWFTDVLPRFTLPLLLGPVFALNRAMGGDRRPVLFYALTALGLVGLSWPSRASSGGALNVLLPAFVLVAILLGLGVYETLRLIGGASARARAFQAYVLGVCVVQFALSAYNPRLSVPYLSDQWADERLAARLGELAGPIFAPDLDGYLRTSDKGEQPHNGAVDEITASYGGTVTDEGLRWREELAAALRQHRFRYVVLPEVEEDCCALKRPVLASGYVDAGPLFGSGDDFFRWKTTHGHTPEVHLYAAPQ